MRASSAAASDGIAGSATPDRPEKEDARHGAGIEVTDRSLAETKCQTAPRDEVPGALHPLRCASNRGRHGVRRGPAVRRRMDEGLRGGPKRIEDGLVADRAASAAGEALGRGSQQRAKRGGVEGWRIASRRAG